MLKESPGVTTYSFETKQQAYERFKAQFRDSPDLVAATPLSAMPEAWRFTLACANDYPRVQRRLAVFDDVVVFCSCIAYRPTKPTDPGYRPSPQPSSTIGR